MKLFGRPRPATEAPARPIVVTLLEGWGTRAAEPHKLAFKTRTPAFNRLVQRSTVTSVDPGTACRSLAGAVSAIAQGKAPLAPHTALDAVLRTSGGLGAHEGFRAFVRDLSKVGGDCHMLCCLTSSGIEGMTEQAAKIAAHLSHEGIRVWVHVVLDGRDTPHDAGLSAMSEFMDDVAGVDQVRFATITGRAHVLDETADTKSLLLARDAMLDAAPQVAQGLGAYIDAENRKGTNDADIKPAADPAYPGLRSDDALLIIHPQPDGFSALVNTLLPDDNLTVPSARPSTLSACRRMIGWPYAAQTTPAGTSPQARAPIALFQPTHPRLPDIIAAAGHSSLIAVPAMHHALAAAHLEGCTPPASRAQQTATALDAAEIAVHAIKQNSHDVIFALLTGAPAAARGGSETLARRTIEQQDKALGRIGAILERRGGTLLALGTDTSLSDASADALPVLLSPGDGHTLLKPGTLANIAPTVLALAGLPPHETFGNASLLMIDEGHDAVASS